MHPPRDLGITLVCPKCRVDVVRVGDAYVCRSSECRLSYPIVDEIPKFLVDDARTLPADEWQTAMRQSGSAEPAH